MALPSPADPGHALSAEQLRLLADRLLEAQHDAAGCLVVGVEADDQQVQLHVLACADPLTVLMGWSAPPTWDGIGTCAGARRHDGDAPTATDVVHLVERGGRSVTALATDATAPVQHLEQEDPVVGLSADACRRALGLATAPPPDDARALVPFLWLDALAAAAMRTPGLDDAACWHLHPALALAEPGSPRSLAARCLRATERVTWPWLRTQCAAGALTSPLTAQEAAWCDDGAFARYALLGLPPVPELCDTVRTLLPVAVADRMLRAVEASCR